MELIGSTDSYSAINLHDGDNRGGPLAILDWFNGLVQFSPSEHTVLVWLYGR